MEYEGEEVRVAQVFSWKAIESALPDEVGILALEDFCCAGVLHYVQHFDEFLVPRELQHRARPPQVVVKDADWVEVCKGLLDRGLSEVLPTKICFMSTGSPYFQGCLELGKVSSMRVLGHSGL